MALGGCASSAPADGAAVETATVPMPPAEAPRLDAGGHAGGRAADRRSATPRRRPAQHRGLLLRAGAESGAQAAGEGGGEPTADLLLRRTLQPEASRIVEESVRFDRTPGARPRPYTVILDVDGDAVTLSESEQRYSGTGMLHGEPWRWDSWDLTYTLTSGIRVDARCALDRGDDGDGRDGGGPPLRADRLRPRRRRRPAAQRGPDPHLDGRVRVAVRRRAPAGRVTARYFSPR